MSIFRWSAASEAGTLRTLNTVRSDLLDTGRTVTEADVRLMSTSNYVHVSAKRFDK